MAQNRKYQSAAVRFAPAVKAFLLCAFIGGAGGGYVWQKERISELGRQILSREKRLAELREQNEKLRKQMATLRSPQFIEMRIRELNLGLAQPEAGQVWRLVEPAAEIPSAATVNGAVVRQYAGRQYNDATTP